MQELCTFLKLAQNCGFFDTPYNLLKQNFDSYMGRCYLYFLWSIKGEITKKPFKNLRNGF